MAVKYYVEYEDTEKVKHSLSIADDTVPVFAPENKVLNGTFSTTNYWTAGANWTVNTGLGRADMSVAILDPSTVLVQEEYKYKAGFFYEVSFEIVFQNGLVPSLSAIFTDGVNEQEIVIETLLGSYTVVVQTNRDYKGFGFRSGLQGGQLSVTNVVVKEQEAPLQVGGTVVLDSTTSDDILETIQGVGLRISLDASTDLTFSDLYSEKEQTFSVRYFRAGDIKFDGWLNVAGLYQDWVNDRWKLGFDCVDGFGYLENLSFVDSGGIPYIGKKTLIEVIRLCLSRTGTERNINIANDIIMQDFTDGYQSFSEISLNVNRYIKEDGDTFMSCSEVLKSVLEPFTCCITYYKDEWFIFRPQIMVNNTTLTFDIFINDVRQGSRDEDLGAILGSQIEDFYPHHCSENQSMTLDRTVSAYRISFKYGVIDAYLANIYLYTANGTSIDDWQILEPTRVDLPAAGGTGINLLEDVAPGTVINFTNDPIALAEGTNVDIVIRGKGNGAPVSFSSTLFFAIIQSDLVLPNPAAKIDYLTLQGTWDRDVFTQGSFPFSTGASTVFDVQCPPLEQDGFFYVQFFDPMFGNVYLTEVTIKPAQDRLSTPAQGEFHTHLRTDNQSTDVKDAREVFQADNQFQFEGTLLNANNDTPTLSWFREGIVEERLLLDIMGEETLRLQAKPQIVFSGDFYGYIPIFSIITLDGIAGVFRFIEYSYDTANNITSCKLKQMFYEDISADLSYQYTLDYGKTVKPTIIN